MCVCGHGGGGGLAGECSCGLRGRGGIEKGGGCCMQDRTVSLCSWLFGTLASFIIISTFTYLTLGFAMFKMEVGADGGGVGVVRGGGGA